MRYLLDTNICVFVIRQKPLQVVQKLMQFSVDELAISTITLAELRFGADKSSDPAKNHTALNLFLAPIAIVDFDGQCAEYYGTLRANLERRGLPIAHSTP